MRRDFDNTRITGRSELLLSELRYIPQIVSFFKNDQVGNPNCHFLATFLICCRGLGSVFLFTFPRIHSPCRASRGAWKWSWLYSMYLLEEEEVESAPGWVNPIFRSSLSTFWSSLGGLSMLPLGPSIYILPFHQSLLHFITFPSNSCVSPALWLFFFPF